jgi:hypothetical protein
MSILSCFVDDETMRLLELASFETGRHIHELAEAAISNAAIEFKVSRMGKTTLTPTLTAQTNPDEGMTR